MLSKYDKTEYSYKIPVIKVLNFQKSDDVLSKLYILYCTVDKYCTVVYSTRTSISCTYIEHKKL